MVRGIVAQRDDAVLGQLADIKGAISELKAAIAVIVQDLGAVRIDELNEVRTKISSLELSLRERIARVDATLAVLEFQARRSGAAAGAWTSAIISVVVATAGALLLHHGG